jgi:hypothetical protein
VSMKRGDHVVARRDLGHMRPVPAGSVGVIRSVSFLGTYAVDFGGKVLTEVKRDDIAPVGGCALLTLVGCVCLTVALTAARRGLAARPRG